MDDPSGAPTPWGLASLEGSEALAVTAYMRVSTAEQKRRYGIPAQADATRTFVEKRSAWRLAGSWEDLGESGSTTSRPALNELLAEIAAGGVDVVLVSSLDRLGRTEAAIWCCLWQIEDAGAVLECCDQALGEPGLGDPGKVRLRQRTWLADGVWRRSWRSSVRRERALLC
ncbi:recombinase family protein [Streptomyces sp. NBC_00882]|uniref:recombinase family protein n=1 Tax=Streptomyces sp. NBC_00882 TaxID=2975856 RepID=UPI003864F40F|nr:recombinase family protein [Streptomyces sp. NBC_00882]